MLIDITTKVLNLTNEKSENSKKEPDELPHRVVDGEHVDELVVLPEGAVLEGKLLPPVPVPECLLEEAGEGVPGPVVDNCLVIWHDGIPAMNGPVVQIDVLGGDEPVIEATSLHKRMFLVGKVAAGVGHIKVPVVELHPLEGLEGMIPHLDGVPGNDIGVTFDGLANLLYPERIGDTVTIGKGNDISFGKFHTEVSGVPSCTRLVVIPDEVIPLNVSLDKLGCTVCAIRIDDYDFEGLLLDHEAVEEVTDMPLFVFDGDDDTDKHHPSLAFHSLSMF